MKYLRHAVDGTIYEWHPVLAENPLCREVTELEAYPERFIPEHAVERVATAKATRAAKAAKVGLTVEAEAAPTGLDLFTNIITDEPDALEAFSADASKGLPS